MVTDSYIRPDFSDGILKKWKYLMKQQEKS